MHQSTTPSLSQTIWPRWASRQILAIPIVQTLLPVTFGYSLSSEAVVIRQLRSWKRLWWRSLTCSHERTSMGPSRSCWGGTTNALQPEEIFMCWLSMKVPKWKKSGNLFNDPYKNSKIKGWAEKFIDWKVYMMIIRGARGVMVIVVGNVHGDTSWNPGQDWLHLT